MSPFLIATFQLSVVADIATSQDTFPAGSKYSARDRKMRFVTPSRVMFRSVHRPPGCRCPAVLTRVASRSATHWLRTMPSERYALGACVGYVNRDFVPEPLSALKTG